MITCKNVCDHSSDLIDSAGKNLTLWTRFKIKFHLVTCELCRRYLRQIRATNEMVGKTGRIPQPTEEEIEATVKKLQDI